VQTCQKEYKTAMPAMQLNKLIVQNMNQANQSNKNEKD
jgi:hypothetical protein